MGNKWTNNDITKIKSALANSNLVSKENETFRLNDNFDNIIKNIVIIKQKYGIDIISLLSNFDDSNHLEKYIASASLINLYSNDNHLDHFKINHILFKIIKQNFISLYSLLSYQFSYLTIDDLKSAYEASAKCQLDLINSSYINNNKTEKLAWFINLKNPYIYWNNKNVKMHYSSIVTNFKDNKSTDIRRMHIFYEDYFKNNELNIKQIKLTFQGLLFEQLINIKSRLIVIKDFNNINKYFYFEKTQINPNESHIEDLRLKNIFLLDFALYQYPSISKSNNFTDYNYHLLPANFGLEAPINSEVEIKLLSEKYDRDSVFEFHGPYLFHIFKNNFQSFWNKERFIQSMDELILHKVWRLLKSKNGKGFIVKIIEDRTFINSVKNYLNQSKVHLDRFIDDLAYNHTNYSKLIKTNEEYIVNAILLTFETGNVDESLKKYLNLSVFDISFINFLKGEIVNFTLKYNALVKHALYTEVDTVAKIKDFFRETFVNNSIYFNEESKELFEEERGFLQLVFEYYTGIEEIFSINADEFKTLEIEILKIRSILNQNIDVLDFFSFWKRIMNDSSLPFNKLDNLLDNLFFDSTEGKSIYLKELGEIKRIDYSIESNLNDLKSELIKDCQRFYDKVLKTSDKRSDMYNAFNEMFREFII